ncbi:sensor histidine kinase [Gulosibacter bifidus]|uniref:histidine kinase n=1 Tax=Gulosibacter bifidus TaxID=272239 RepID=A0ABW5RGR3_9MICO|nr:histidine kinase [Gulosibacter bifidus]
MSTTTSTATAGPPTWTSPLSIDVGTPAERGNIPAWMHEWFSHQPRHVRIIDTLVALAVMLFVGFPFQLRPDWSYFLDWQAFFVWIPFTGAVAMRRMSPWLALVLAGIGLLIKWMLGLPLHGMDIAVLIVLYTGSARGPRLLFMLSGACSIIWPVIQAVYVAYFEMQLPFLDRITGRANLGPTEFLLPMGIVGIPLLLASIIAWVAGGILRVQLSSSRIQHAAELAELEYRQTQEELVREQERTYIARDMHDIVAHSLAVVVAQADGGRYLMKSSPEAVGPVLNTISETARDALVDVRGLLGRLRHTQSDAVKKTTEDLPAVFDRVRQAGMNLQTKISGTPKPLGTAGEVAVFRLVQECLTNALKYGSLQHPTTVDMNWGDHLSIEIRNRMDRAPSAPGVTGSGHGLIGMRERILVVGGEVRYEQQDCEWVVSATVPYQQGSAASATPGLPHPDNVDA